MNDTAQAIETLAPQEAVTLYYSGLCFQSLKIKAVLDKSGIRYRAKEVEFGSPTQLPSLSIYKSTPVLAHAARLIEDSSAIILYFDEVFNGAALQSIAAEDKALLFERMELLDYEILPALVAPLAVDSALYASSVALSGRGLLYSKFRLLTKRRRLWRCLCIEDLSEIDNNFFQTLVRCATLIREDFLMEDKSPYLAISLRSALEGVRRLERFNKLIEQQPIVYEWLVGS